ILLIDDDADWSRLLQLALEERGHVVRCLEGAERGLDVLRDDPRDVILLDNWMPGVSGLGFLQALQDHDLRIPVIFMTGDASSEPTIQAMTLGAFDYVVKPLDVDDLVREIEPLIAEALRSARSGPEAARGAAEADDQAAPVMRGTSKAMREVYK